MIEQGNNNQEIYPKDINDYLDKIKAFVHPNENSNNYNETIIDDEDDDDEDDCPYKKLDIYRYSAEDTLKDNKDNKNTITILFVGQSGAGKSTLINAYLNYLLGVFCDKPIRYKIVLGNKEKEKDQTMSQTSEIAVYQIKSPLYPGITFKLIDTPGFADTGNKESDSKIEMNAVDKEHLKKFNEFFNEKLMEEDDKLKLAICFVVKASENRVTNFQKTIISNILNLFGKDVGSNFLALLTHSDSSSPDAKKALIKEIEIFNKKKENKEKWCWCFSSIKYFEIIKGEGGAGQYKDNIKSFISFTNELMNLPEIDLKLTKTNLLLKNCLNVLKKTIKEENLSVLLNHYEALKDSEEKLNEQIKNYNEKNVELLKKQVELAEQQKKCEEYAKKIEEKNKEIENHKNKIEDCNQKIENYHQDLEKINNDKSKLENDISKEEKKLKEMNLKKREAEDELKKIENELKNYTNDKIQAKKIERLKNNMNFADEGVDGDIERVDVPHDVQYVIKTTERKEKFNPFWCPFNGFWWWNFNVSIADQKTGTEIMTWRGRGCARSSIRKLNSILDELEK